MFKKLGLEFVVLEEKSIFWNDDVEFVISMIVKTIKRFNELSDADQTLMPLYKDQEDRDFTKYLIRKAIIYHDSFGGGLKPYLSLHFSNSLFLHKGSQQNDLFSYAFIDQFDPDVIIIEIVERDLPSLQFLLDKFH